MASYLIEELTIRKGGEDELDRVITILADLLRRVKEKKKLTEHEKYFFCTAGIKLEMIPGTLDDYDCCANFKFTDIYLSYWYDLYGNSSYTKIKKGVEYVPSKTEIKNDIVFLHLESRKWERIIKIENHSNLLLQEVSKEARKELKALSKDIGKIYFRRQIIEFNLFKLKILLQSKNIYCRSLLVLEKFKEQGCELSLNGNKVEIDEYSVVHILNRHFAEMTKHNPSKSFHNENFEPDYLNIQLSDIFQEIDNSHLLIGQEISDLTFKYNNVIYRIWVKSKTRQAKGGERFDYYRLETFYPLEEKQDLDLLLRDYSLEYITKNIEIYIKN